ncbi:MAG: hypothetical protein IJ584_15650 [Bacteroidales bacterium]|nr:hypothetical protein [Bacteroidales bacterium]
MEGNNKVISYLVKEIVTSNILQLPCSLFHGQMGICIALYYISEYLQDESVGNSAEIILDSISQTLQRKRDAFEIGFEHGYTGIASGTLLLASRGFILIDNDYLDFLDEKILSFILSNERSFLSNDLSVILGLWVYLIIRISFEKGKYRDLIEDSLKTVINSVDFNNEQTSYSTMLYEPIKEDPLHFYLPSFLILLGKTYSLGVHKVKIERIIERLNYLLRRVRPQYPLSDFYLRYSLEFFEQKIGYHGWKDYLSTLRSYDLGLLNEFSNKIYINNGLSGLILFSKLCGIDIDSTVKAELMQHITALYKEQHELAYLRNFSLYRGIPGILLAVSL